MFFFRQLLGLMLVLQGVDPADAPDYAAKKPEEFEDPTELEDFYVSTAEFPAGFMTQYTPSMLIAL